LSERSRVYDDYGGVDPLKKISKYNISEWAPKEETDLSMKKKKKM
jgi:hypothetical protein